MWTGHVGSRKCRDGLACWCCLLFPCLRVVLWRVWTAGSIDWLPLSGSLAAVGHPDGHRLLRIAVGRFRCCARALVLTKSGASCFVRFVRSPPSIDRSPAHHCGAFDCNAFTAAAPFGGCCCACDADHQSITALQSHPLPDPHTPTPTQAAHRPTKPQANNHASLLRCRHRLHAVRGLRDRGKELGRQAGWKAGTARAWAPPDREVGAPIPL